MDPTSINIPAVLAAVAAKQALGFLWYSPMLFGGSFALAAGVTPEQMVSTLRRRLAWDVLATLLTALALDYAIVLFDATSWFYGLLLAMGCWLCFAVPASAAPTLFEGRPLRLFGLQAGYFAVSYGVMGAVLGGWR